MRGKLAGFEGELRAAGLKEATIHAYLAGSLRFVRWLDGEYEPGALRNGHSVAPKAPTRS